MLTFVVTTLHFNFSKAASDAPALLFLILKPFSQKDNYGVTNAGSSIYS